MSKIDFSKATPRPWHRYERFISDHIGWSGNIAVVQPDHGEVACDANAELIVRAVNAYDELVAAAETHLLWIEREREGPLYPFGMKRDSPGGEAVWRAWWEDQLRLCALTEAQCRAVLDKIKRDAP